ncbi:MAG TPA: hypothetical protein QGH10_26590 [Armatimonadota bacterium]|nr:hypothetical protein [Armatimonadota bacterium]
MKRLGHSSPGETYMEQLDRGEALIRTRDQALARRLLSWQRTPVEHWGDYFEVRTGNLIYTELRFDMRAWTRVGKTAGLIPRPKVTLAQRRARRANAAKARAALRERREASIATPR